RRVIGEQAEVVTGNLDLAQVEGPDGTVGDRQVVTAAGPAVGNMQRSGRLGGVWRHCLELLISRGSYLASAVCAITILRPARYRRPAGGGSASKPSGVGSPAPPHRGPDPPAG